MPAQPTLADVARACRVSLATASKALNPHADRCDLAAATRDRVLAAAARLGYSRDTVESAKRRKRFHNLGLAWNRHAPRVGGVYEHLIENAAEVAQELGFHLLFTPLSQPDAWRPMQLSQRLDGVIVVEAMHDAVLAEMEAAGYPAVTLNLETPRRLHQLLVDEAHGARLMVEHLHALGHRRCIYLPLGTDYHYCDRERGGGLRAAAAACGLAMEAMPRGDLAGVAARCATRGGPTAVIAFQDTDAVQALRALAAAGLDVPGRVSVACIGDASWFHWIEPAMTVVSVPINDMARLAVRRVAELVATDGRPQPRVERLAGTVTARASTGPARRR